MSAATNRPAGLTQVPTGNGEPVKLTPAALAGATWTLEFLHVAEADHYIRAEYGSGEVCMHPKMSATSLRWTSIPSVRFPTRPIGRALTLAVARRQGAAIVERAKLMVAHAQGRAGLNFTIPQVRLCANGEVVA